MRGIGCWEIIHFPTPPFLTGHGITVSSGTTFTILMVEVSAVLSKLASWGSC